MTDAGLRKHIKILSDIFTVIVVVTAAHYWPREVIALIAYGCWLELDSITKVISNT